MRTSLNSLYIPLSVLPVVEISAGALNRSFTVRAIPRWFELQVESTLPYLFCFNFILWGLYRCFNSLFRARLGRSLWCFVWLLRHGYNIPRITLKEARHQSGIQLFGLEMSGTFPLLFFFSELVTLIYVNSWLSLLLLTLAFALTFTLAITTAALRVLTYGFGLE